MVGSKLLQEAADVMRTDFWKLYVSRLNDARQNRMARLCKDGIEKQEQWIRFAYYKGEFAAFDKAVALPDEILGELRKGA